MKKIFIGLWTMMLSISVFAQGTIFGDINDDGKLSLKDAELLSEKLVAGEGVGISKYDIDKNGTFNICDVTTLVKMVNKASAGGIGVGIDGWDDGENFGGTVNAPVTRHALYAENSAFVCLYEYSNNDVILGVRMPDSKYNGFDFSLSLPQGLDIKNESAPCYLVGSPAEDGSILKTKLSADKKQIRIVGCTAKGVALGGGSDFVKIVCTLSGDIADYTVSFTDGKLSVVESCSLFTLQNSVCNVDLFTKALISAKSSAKTELASYKNPSDYRSAEQIELANAIAAGNAAIDACTTIEDVVLALANAKDALDAIKTDAQLTAEEEAALAEEIRLFRELYSDILNKTLETISIDDKDDVIAALNAFDNLSDAAKEALLIEKNLLDSLLSKINDLVDLSSVRMEEDQSDIIYSISGQKISNLSTSGFYVKNGKKILVR